MNVGDRVRVRLTPDEYGILWGHFAAEHGTVGEVIGLEQRSDGRRVRVRLPAEVWPFECGLVYRSDELELLE